MEGRRDLIGYALVVASARTRGANIFGRVSLGGKPGFQAFLIFESDPVRTKPYPHDYSSGSIREHLVQRFCQFASAHAGGKSLKMKEDEENAAHARFGRHFAA